MTTSIDFLTQLRRDWQARCHDGASRAAFARLRDRHPELNLDRYEDLSDVLGLLESRGGRCVLDRAHLVQVLLEEAGDATLRRALLQTLLPGIVSVCRQLRFGEGIIDDPSETLGVAIALCAELLVDWAGQSRQYAAPDLLSALRGRLRRWLLKEKVARRSTAVAPDVEVVVEPASELLTRLERLRGGRYDRLARLTYARVFEGVPLRALAERDHSSTRMLQRELQVFALEQLL